ncbi:unnamed protein product [Brassica rapa subsp. narinosa]
MIFQQKLTHWRYLLQAAYQDTKEWMEAQQFTEEVQPGQPRRSPNSKRNEWKRPEMGFVKCNYDGSFYNINTPAQAGWLIRDSTGLFKGAGQFKTRKPHNALESELQALLGAMMICWSQGYTKVIFEGDNINVINLFKKRTKNINVVNWLRDIWKWEQKFESLQYTWTDRESNSCADLLAKQQLQDNDEYIYHPCIPNVIRDVISVDYFDH